MTKSASDNQTFLDVPDITSLPAVVWFDTSGIERLSVTYKWNVSTTNAFQAFLHGTNYDDFSGDGVITQVATYGAAPGGLTTGGQTFVYERLPKWVSFQLASVAGGATGSVIAAASWK